MRRTSIRAILFLVVMSAGVAARAARGDEGPSPARADRPGEIALSVPLAQEAPLAGTPLAREARLQTAGKAMLAAAIAFMLAGVVLVEVDPYSLAVGDWGFASVGVGVGSFVASAFLLGLSRPVHIHDHPAERTHRFGLTPGRGLALGYARTF